jgi:HAMP domain-containing protein
MIKSVFAKYVITFMALLLVSFLLLMFIVNSVVNNTAIRTERSDIMGVASASAEGLAELYLQSGKRDFDDFIRSDAETAAHGMGASRLLSAVLTNFEDMTVYVTDASGGFLFSAGKFSHTAPAVGTQILSPENLSALPSLSPRRETYAEEETLPDGMGVFLTEHSLLSSTQSFLFVLPIVAEEHSAGSLPMGYVVVTSTAETQGNMMNATFRSMVVAALWIMLAALIAIYFITERVISPLREMSRAAKRMAVGRFDVRVPVHGRDEVAELAVAFNQMSQALENLERMRNSFVANYQ